MKKIVLISAVFLMVGSWVEAIPWPIDGIDGHDNIAQKWIGKTYLNFNLRQDDMVKQWKFREFHTGIDIVAWEGTEVKAVRDGYVFVVQKPSSKGTASIFISDELYTGQTTISLWGYGHTKDFWNRDVSPPEPWEYRDPVSVGTRLCEVADFDGWHPLGNDHLHLARIKYDPNILTLPGGNLLAGIENPLKLLDNYTDKDKPKIKEWLFCRNDTVVYKTPIYFPRIEGDYILYKDDKGNGEVDIVVRVQDVTPIWANGAGVYEIGYQILDKNKKIIKNYSSLLEATGEQPPNYVENKNGRWRLNGKVVAELADVIYQIDDKADSDNGKFYYVVTNTDNDGKVEWEDRDYCWDTTKYPDGEYYVQVIAKDIKKGNIAEGNECKVYITNSTGLKGKVTDVAGNPIQGAQVWLKIGYIEGEEGERAYVAYSDSNGMFQFNPPLALIEKGYDLIISKIEYVSYTRVVFPEFGKIKDVGVIVLEKTGSISGYIKKSNGKALPGATIVAVPIGSDSGPYDISKSDGSYKISNLKSGLYIIVVFADGYLEVRLESMSISAGEDRKQDFVLVRNSVAGNVSRIDNNNPIQGAKITFKKDNYERSVITGGEGNYYIEELDEGIYTITTTAPGYYPYTINGIEITYGKRYKQDFKLTEIDNIPPTIANSKATPDIVKIGESVIFSADVTDNKGVSEVTIDLRPIGGNAKESMIKGESNKYTCQTKVALNTQQGKKSLIITAKDLTNNSSIAQVSLYVRIDPQVTISPTSGTIGTEVTIKGDGYLASEQIRIDFGTTRSIAVTTADSSGSFTANFTVDSQSVGIVTITAVSIKGEYKASGIFNITADGTGVANIKPDRTIVNMTWVFYITYIAEADLSNGTITLTIPPNWSVPPDWAITVYRGPGVILRPHSVVASTIIIPIEKIFSGGTFTVLYSGIPQGTITLGTNTFIIKSQGRGGFLTPIANQPVVYVEEIINPPYLIQLTTAPYYEVPAGYSPDNNKIIYCARPKELNAIWTMDINGANKKELIKDDKYHCSPIGFSPDGKMLFFNKWWQYSGTGTEDGVWVLRNFNEVLDGNPPSFSKIVNTLYGSSISPDGKVLTLSVYNKLSKRDILAVVNLQDVINNQVEPILKEVIVGQGDNVAGDWSPDGKILSFYSTRSGDSDAWVIKNIQDVLFKGAEPDLLQLTHWQGYDSDGVFSPDGEKYAFTSNKDNYKGRWNCWVITNIKDVIYKNAEPKFVHLIPSLVVEGPSTWSQDATKLLIGSYRAGNWDVWVMDYPYDESAAPAVNITSPTLNQELKNKVIIKATVEDNISVNKTLLSRKVRVRP